MQFISSRKHLLVFWISFSLLVLFPSPLLAQGTINLVGTLIDESTQEPIAGASVQVKDQKIGTTTDAEGQFKLTVSSGSFLVISRVGYTTKEIAVAQQTTLTISLAPITQDLGEVVVVGYGGVKKKDLTGAIAVINPDEQNRVKATTATDLLLGKVAGLQVTLGSGSPGSSGTVRIRQGASLNASNEPLIVVDGLTEGSLSSINPNDIESITVLKDASAAAIYGARGANGVIIVKTKKGLAGAGNTFVTPTVNYRADVYVNRPFNYLEVYDADAFREEYTKRGWNTALLGNENTDWQKQISRTSITNLHTISLAGAAPYTPYRFSFGFNEEQGNVLKAKRNVTTTALQLSPKLLNNHISIDATLRYTHTSTPHSGSSFAAAALADPTQPVHYDYGPATVNGVTYPQKAFGYFMYGADALGNNPDKESNEVASALLPNTGYNKGRRFLTNFLMSYKVHGVRGLTLNAGFNSSSNNTELYTRGIDNTPRTWAASNVNLGKGGIGQNSSSSSYSRKTVVDYYANYSKAFQQHNIDITVGHTFESLKYGSWSGPVSFNDGELVSGSVENSSKGEVAMASWFSRLNYKLFNRFLLTGTLRADASSRFAPETRWGIFPSGAIAWNISDEKFMEGSKAVNDLKFRISYGATGQQDINNDYAYQASYFASTQNFMYREGNEFYTTYRPSAFNRAIQWEVTKTMNVGLDYGFFKNRLYGSLDFYTRYTSNLLMNSVMVTAGSNFAESADQNIGEMSSKGFEFAIGGELMRKKDFSWTANFNFSYNTSKIERLTVYDGPPEDTWVRTGFSGSNRSVQYHKVGNSPNTYFLAKQVYDANGLPLEQFYNPLYDHTVSGSAEYVYDDAANANKWDTRKSSLVPYYGGFSTQISYKAWDFGSNMHYAFGHYLYWNTMSSGSDNSFFQASGQYPTNTFKGYAPEWEKQHYFSDHWLFKGDYFKIDNVVMGYTFRKVFSAKSSLRVGLGVQNLATITHYPGVDPEVYNGIDGSSTPKQRMFMLSLNVKF